MKDRPSTPVFLVGAASLMVSGCDFLPQTGTEWGIALGVFGVLFIGAVGAAWWGAKKNRPK
jgi:LPXTG-motif cell wall-anchored protein